VERVAGSTEEERVLARDALTNSPQRLLETGIARCTIRKVPGGRFGKGPSEKGRVSGTSLVAY